MSSFSFLDIPYEYVVTVFHGAFALELAEGRALDEIIRWSSAAAALKCTRRGAKGGFPTRDDVANLMKEVQE